MSGTEWHLWREDRAWSAFVEVDCCDNWHIEKGTFGIRIVEPDPYEPHRFRSRRHENYEKKHRTARNKTNKRTNVTTPRKDTKRNWNRKNCNLVFIVYICTYAWCCWCCCCGFWSLLLIFLLTFIKQFCCSQEVQEKARERKRTSETIVWPMMERTLTGSPTIYGCCSAKGKYTTMNRTTDALFVDRAIVCTVASFFQMLSVSVTDAISCNNNRTNNVSESKMNRVDEWINFTLVCAGVCECVWGMVLMMRESRELRAESDARHCVEMQIVMKC